MPWPKQILLATLAVIVFFLTLGTGFSQVTPTAPKEIILGAALPLTPPTLSKNYIQGEAHLFVVYYFPSS